jgi:predicted DNA-binding transcriptional regulator AlpA
MMKQLSDLRIVYPASPDKRTDYIPQPKHSKPVTDPSQLPMALNAKQVAAVLGISRAGAYNLMRSEGFPTLFIGKRMVVPKDRLMDWMNTQIKM